MSNKLECVAGVYDNSAGQCRPYEDVETYSAGEEGDNNERPCPAMENSQKYFVDTFFFDDRDKISLHKSYWINEAGVISDELFDVINREGEAQEQAYREWRWADTCGKAKEDILNGVGMLSDIHAALNCFESVYLPLSNFSTVVDFYSGAVVNPWNRERLHGHNMLAVDRNGQGYHAVGLQDGYIRVLDMFKKTFKRELVGQPPPVGLRHMRVFDANNDHDTDWVDARMFSGDRFDNVACALALFDPIWNNASLPESITYVPDFVPGELKLYVKMGDEVRTGERLFAFEGREPYRAEMDGEVNGISYYRQGEQMSLTIDRKKERKIFGSIFPF
ncbi:MAG: hypothetical protein HY609_06350 [Deltaproteobacteria bacterium]|nr:hypothetical protein [Deltaproteobacteria bacterium]